MMKQTLGVTLIAALAGCGGGGGDDGQPNTGNPPASAAAGFYGHTTAGDEDQLTMVFEDGSYYILLTGDDLGAATMIIGKGEARNGSFTSTDGRRYDAGPTVPLTVSASYVSKQSFNGTATSTSPAKTSTFTGTYDAAYDRTPQLSAMAGTYTGITGSRLFLEDATVVVNASGSVTGTGQSGCKLSGTVKPKAAGNAFDITYTFGASPCAAANQTFNGVALAEDGELLAITTSTDKEYAVIFAGARSPH